MQLPALCVLFFAQDLDNFINCGSECQARAAIWVLGCVVISVNPGFEARVKTCSGGRKVSSSEAMLLSCVLCN